MRHHKMDRACNTIRTFSNVCMQKKILSRLIFCCLMQGRASSSLSSLSGIVIVLSIPSMEQWISGCKVITWCDSGSHYERQKSSLSVTATVMSVFRLCICVVIFISILQATGRVSIQTTAAKSSCPCQYDIVLCFLVK